MEQVTVAGGGPLLVIDVDMTDMSDTVQTLAAVAVVVAETPTRVREIGLIWGKNRPGSCRDEPSCTGPASTRSRKPTGFTADPGVPRATRFAAYDDHRMAVNLSSLGLRVPAIEIAGPGCATKTSSGFFCDLAAVAAAAACDVRCLSATATCTARTGCSLAAAAACHGRRQ